MCSILYDDDDDCMLMMTEYAYHSKHHCVGFEYSLKRPQLNTGLIAF